MVFKMYNILYNKISPYIILPSDPINILKHLLYNQLKNVKGLFWFNSLYRYAQKKIAKLSKLYLVEKITNTISIIVSWSN